MRSQALVTMLRTAAPVRVGGSSGGSSGGGRVLRLELSRFACLLRFDDEQQAAEFVELHKVWAGMVEWWQA
jgi:hypothetical protein